jgi:hypothetical protein
MFLYHGSNVVVEKPRLISPKRLLDFGAGFYLTSDLEQARKWASRTTLLREEGQAVVSVYDVYEKELQMLAVLLFDSPNREWLRYVAANRMGRQTDTQYDVIIGPVANDQVIRTVNNYLNGYFTEDIAIQLLLPQKLKDQYAFKTDKAIQILHFLEARS